MSWFTTAVWQQFKRGLVAEASLYYEILDVLASAGPPLCFPYAWFSIIEGGRAEG